MWSLFLRISAHDIEFPLMVLFPFPSSLLPFYLLSFTKKLMDNKQCFECSNDGGNDWISILDFLIRLHVTPGFCLSSPLFDGKSMALFLLLKQMFSFNENISNSTLFCPFNDSRWYCHHLKGRIITFTHVLFVKMLIYVIRILIP